jgi:ribosomal protein L24E
MGRRTGAKHCAVCGKPVLRGTGTYYAHRLVHKKCLPYARYKRYDLYYGGRRR